MPRAPNPRQARGALGERLAGEHLASRGYTVLERNFRTRYGELDLVATDARSIVFCEVKTRVAGGRSGPAAPLDAVGPAKRVRLRRLAGEWLRERSAGARRPSRDELRFDAIGVTLSATGELLALEHIEGAF